ncbi:F-box only protein 5 [Camponotus floridanus]|uniref:F-box only protein 5 n=1 Tax=Camponotus floridanus TaxID=104421 RepID=UPI00059E2932|nr:F-box only protein 5 [Camponotus floridanus]
MEEVESMPISVDASSHDSVDSGYLSILTPHTSGCSSMTGYRTRSSSGALLSAKKCCRFRTDPFQCEKAQRRRSKLNHTLNASESDYLVSESSSVEQESSCTNVNQSLSLVHSTPSCADNKYTEILRIKNRRNWRTTVLITPASNDFQLLSPPLSPAVPSSSFVASEPVEEDVEMKLVHSEGKSQVQATPPRLRVSIPRIVISPARRRISPAITSENQKLSKLCIADLSEIKPKRLDFSHRGLALRNNIRRATLDYTGREKVDFLSLLGEESNHLNLVSKILSYLGPPDLCSVSMVSAAWRRICENDSGANGRRMSYILRKQNIKENLKVTFKKAKREEDIQTSPKSRHYVRKGFLVDVQNFLYVPAQPRPPNSPPVSPSKVKFHSYVKASRTLASGEYLLPCPKCRFPCHVDSEKNVGTCSRQGCSIEFCISCSSKPHTGPCKTPLLATPTKRNNKRLIVGSRQSKRNLRRL